MLPAPVRPLLALNVAVAIAFAAGACAASATSAARLPVDRFRFPSGLTPGAAFERVLARTRSLGYVTDEVDERRAYLRIFSKHHRDGAAPLFYAAFAPGRPSYLLVQVFADGSVGVRAECAHLADGEPIPDELFDELLAYGRALRDAVAPTAPAPAVAPAPRR